MYLHAHDSLEQAWQGLQRCFTFYNQRRPLTITFNAAATDNEGVTKLEFCVDSVLKGADTTTPYSMTLDSLTLIDATHTWWARPMIPRATLVLHKCRLHG